MLQNKKQIAAIYVRVSTEEQASEGQSLSAQIETLTQYCKVFDMEIFKIYKDAGFSGKETKNRPALNELISDSTRKLFSLVLVWKISRLSRNLKDLLQILDIFERNNVSFSSYSEKFDTSTPVGKMTLQLLGSIAEFERNTIVENVKLGLTEYARKGGKTGTVLGYDNINKQLVINKAEAQIVKLIYELYIDKRLPLTAIASYLNSKGFHTKRGSSFRGDAIAIILDNPVYIGINRHNLKTENPYTTSGAHEPIIEPEVWKKAHSLRSASFVSPVPHRKSQSSLLSGLISCPCCQHSMGIFYTKSHNKLYRYYKCAHKGCNARLVNADKLESAMVNILHMMLANPQVLNDVTKATVYNRATADRNIVRTGFELDMEISRQQTALSRYLNLIEAGKMENEGLLLERIHNINARIRALELEKSVLLQTAQNSKLLVHLGEARISSLPRALSTTLAEADSSEKRRLLEGFIKKLYIKKDGTIEQLDTLFPITFI